MKTLDSIDVKDKRVLLRADLNVPLQDGIIQDDARIVGLIPTLQEILNQKPKSILILAHLGRPDGHFDDKLTLLPIVTRLTEIIELPVHLISHQQIKKPIDLVGINILDNIRFDPRDTSKDESERMSLAQELAKFGDIFISDGFGVVHRKQASVYELAKELPAAAGRLIEREISVFDRVLNEPIRPYTVILGGAKVSDKLKVVNNLLEHADTLIIGGGMAYTFLYAKGFEVGQSLLDKESVDAVKDSIQRAKAKNIDLLLPVDVIIADRFAPDAETKIVSVDQIPMDWMGLDIGPATREIFTKKILSSATVVWNGPMGVFEMDKFAQGTLVVAQSMAACAGFTVIGGGDSASAIKHFGLNPTNYSHISTGGGASLEYLEGKKLPGIEVLMETQ